MSEIKDIRNVIFTPMQVSKSSLAQVEKVAENIRNNRGAGIDIDAFKDYFVPVLPGQVCAIIGQTSNNKSGMMHFVEYQLAKKAMEEGRENDIIVHVSVEETVEEQGYNALSRYSGIESGKIAIADIQNWDTLRKAATTAGNLPIYRIGDSLANPEDIPQLYMSNMIKAIKYLRDDLLDWRPNIMALFFDYLQAFPYDPEIRRIEPANQRRLQVREDMYRLRLAAAQFNCPVFVAVQAKQKLEGARPPVMLPGIYDGEESSSIAQRCDRVLTVWMPKTTMFPGEHFTAAEKDWVCAENMFWIKVAKQRGGLPAGKTFPCRIDFASNHIKIDPDYYRLTTRGFQDTTVADVG